MPKPTTIRIIVVIKARNRIQKWRFLERNVNHMGVLIVDPLSQGRWPERTQTSRVKNARVIRVGSNYRYLVTVLRRAAANAEQSQVPDSLWFWSPSRQRRLLKPGRPRKLLRSRPLVGATGSAGRFRCGVQAPVAVVEPVLAEQFHRVLCAVGTIAALERIDRAVLVAAPADSLGMFRVQWKFLCHVSIGTGISVGVKCR